jgi:hypothetical protein
VRRCECGTSCRGGCWIGWVRAFAFFFEFVVAASTLSFISSPSSWSFISTLHSPPTSHHPLHPPSHMRSLRFFLPRSSFHSPWLISGPHRLPLPPMPTQRHLIVHLVPTSCTRCAAQARSVRACRRQRLPPLLLHTFRRPHNQRRRRRGGRRPGVRGPPRRGRSMWRRTRKWGTARERLPSRGRSAPVVSVQWSGWCARPSSLCRWRTGGIHLVDIDTEGEDGFGFRYARAGGGAGYMAGVAAGTPL